MEMAKSQSFIFMTLLLFSLALDFGVNGRDTKLDPNSILKTIVAGDEIIDCVNIYKQPAFNHPLLKNHTLRLKPSSHPTGSKSKVSVNSTKLTQMWHMNGEYCPKGTVPILRSSTTDLPPKNAYDRFRAFGNATAIDRVTLFPKGIPHPELATAFVQGFDYYGANAEMSVWNPQTHNPGESTSSQIWVTDGGGEIIESIEAGWVATAKVQHPSYFTYWTVDGYGASGCYNEDCPGFVKTNRWFLLGSQVRPVSVYGGPQYSTNIKIFQDLKTSDWWLNIQGSDIGYWPGELFTKLKGSSQRIEWGGRVVNTEPLGIHTTTHMGSGHFPKEGGKGRIAWIQKLEYVDGNGFFNHVIELESQATRPECYNVKVQDWDKDVGASLLYGGPGLSLACQK